MEANMSNQASRTKPRSEIRPVQIKPGKRTARSLPARQRYMPTRPFGSRRMPGLSSLGSGPSSILNGTPRLMVGSRRSDAANRKHRCSKSGAKRGKRVKSPQGQNVNHGLLSRVDYREISHSTWCRVESGKSTGQRGTRRPSEF